MAKRQINFNKSLKPVLILYFSIFIIGTIFACVFGVNLDINFKGGTKITYSYSGEISKDDFNKSIKNEIKSTFKTDFSTSIAGDTKTVSISLAGNSAISAANQEKVTKTLVEAFKDNKIELYDSNSVSPSIAGAFFIKSLVAVSIAAIIVIIYVGIRFKKIGGVSAGIAALVALIFDVFITFFVCVFFRLQIDANYIAVVLTILGYSLNDTIVTFDRIRENKNAFPEMDTYELVNSSINMTIVRNVVTSVTTFIAVVTIVVVSELFGLTTLRTFGIPMAFGVIFGSLSSICIAGPLWVVWQNKKKNKSKAKARAV